MGDFEQYCDELAERGEWAAALQVAPAAGGVYWRQLCRRYCRSVVKLGDAELDAVPLCLAAGELAQAATILRAHGRVNDAFAVLATHSRLRNGPASVPEAGPR